MEERTYESARPSLAELQTEVDGVEFTAAYRLPRGTWHHLLAMPALAWRLWRAVGRSAFVHGGPATVLRPFQNLALLFGWMRGRTTVFVNDIDHRESPRMSLQAGLYSYGAYWRAQYLQRPWFDLQLRLAGLLCSTLLLKGRALVDDYGRGRPHVHFLLDCAHSAEVVLDDERMLAKHRRIADLGRPLRTCYLGRLVAYKGVDRMVEAVAQARRNGADVTFDIFGVGDCEGALREQVLRLQLERVVTFHGPKPYGPKLFAELEQFDLILAAVLAQDTPRSAIDAQAAGMGVLAFDTYYYRELQELGGGVELVPWADVTALAAAMAELATDRERVVAMSRRAVEFARRNSQEDWLRRRAEWTFGRAPASDPAAAGQRAQRT
jgi:glycosyltransferase involved in cell wall biosynthesis